MCVILSKINILIVNC